MRCSLRKQSVHVRWSSRAFVHEHFIFPPLIRRCALFNEVNEIFNAYNPSGSAKTRVALAHERLEPRLEPRHFCNATNTLITQQLFDNERYRSSRRISIFLSMSHEVDTYEILKNIFDSGKECFVPKYE